MLENGPLNGPLEPLSRPGEEIVIPASDTQERVVIDFTMASLLPDDDAWAERIREWWEQRQAERGTPPEEDDPLPRPYLRITGDLASQVSLYGRDQPGYITFLVWNEGIAPTTTCYVEIYDGPGGFHHPISSYHLRGSTVISLQPGERRMVTLPWVARQQGEGRLVGLCYDPLSDPFTLGGFVHPVDDHHISSVHYYR